MRAHAQMWSDCAAMLASTVVDLARAQFATTSIYHFFFVPLTLGLGPIVAIFQTLWHRTGEEHWYRLTRFFGTLFLINFAIGVATGLVQEFQFGMNWSVYSEFVGDVFGAPLAIEGLAAFFLESTFLGLWIFGWNRLSAAPPSRNALDRRHRHLAVRLLHPRGELVDAEPGRLSAGRTAARELTSVWDLLSSRWALYAFVHTVLAGLTAGGAVVFGVCCWHLVRGRNQELFKPAAKVALIVLVPVSTFNLWFGSHFGILVTELQPMKISASEAQWDTCQPCAFSLFQIGGFTQDDQTPSFDIEIPCMLSFLATGSFNGEVQGLNELQSQYEKQYGPGNYLPPVRAVYWSMRVMAYAGSLVALVARSGRLAATGGAGSRSGDGSSGPEWRPPSFRSSPPPPAGASRSSDGSHGSSRAS